MGSLFSSLSRLLGSKKNVKMVMVGLDGAGKTTILYKLKLGEVVETIPTIGFNMETIRYKNISFIVWDIGGQYKIRALWRYYYSGVDAAIFVVDASDTQRERLDECREEIHYLMNENELANAAVLVFANKQDLPGALSASAVAERLDLLSLQQRKWYVQASSAKTGHGIFQGLEWVAHVIQQKGFGNPPPFNPESAYKPDGNTGQQQEYRCTDGPVMEFSNLAFSSANRLSTTTLKNGAEDSAVTKNITTDELQQQTTTS